MVGSRPVSFVRLCGLVFCSFLLGLTQGCGGPLHKERDLVSCHLAVTYDGQPVSGGMVNLVGDTPGDAGGADLSPQGSVVVKVPAGRYTVVVVPPPESPTAGLNGSAATRSEDARNDVPRVFWTKQTSPLKVDVSATSRNAFEFDLKASMPLKKSPADRR